MLIELKEPVRRRRRGRGDHSRGVSIAEAIDTLQDLLYFAGSMQKKEDKKDEKKKAMFELSHIILMLGILSPFVGLTFTAYLFNIALAVVQHVK